MFGCDCSIEAKKSVISLFVSGLVGVAAAGAGADEVDADGAEELGFAVAANVTIEDANKVNEATPRYPCGA